MTMLPRVIPMPDRKAALVEGLADHLGRHRESYFAVCLVLAALVPVLAVKLPPMADLLGHMGRYSIQTDLEQHPWLKQYYGFEWQVIGNLGTALLVELLHPFYGVETSVRLIVILNQLLAAAAVIALCREVHGRVTSFCLLALPLIYSLPFNYRFLNYTLSMALALLAFVLWLRLTRLGHVRLRQCVFVPVGLAVWTCHAYGWAFLGLLCTASCMVRSHEAGRRWPLILWDTGLNCLPLLAPVIPMLLWRGEDGGGDTTGWFQLLGKLLWLQWMLRLDWEIFDKVSAIFLLSISLFGIAGNRIPSNKSISLAAWACFLAFILMPIGIFGSYYADMRLAPYAVMLALLALDDGQFDSGPRRWLMAAAALFLVGRLATTTAVYVERERVLDAHLEALETIPERARVASLVLLPCPTDWELPWLSHVGGMAVARRHAFSNDQWAEPGMNPLTISYPEAGDFERAPSSITYPERCKPPGVQMGAAVASLPKAAFTHVWIVGIPAQQIPRPEGSTVVWRGRDSAVFGFDRASPGADSR